MYSNLSYILINNNKNVLKMSNDLIELIKFIKININQTIDILTEYNGNIDKFKQNILNWKISVYQDTEICHYYFDSNFILKSTDPKITNTNYTILFPNQTNNTNNTNNKAEEDIINKIFLSESNVNCNIPFEITPNDIKNIEYVGTETLVKQCLNDESIKQNNQDVLRNRLKKLQEMRDNELNTKKRYHLEIEKEMKLTKEKEEEYLRKFMVDRKLYFVFKQEILDEKRQNDNIPKLYAKQWYIFSEMEKDNTLDTDNTVIDDQNTTIIQKELCIYREIDNKCKDIVFDSK